MKSRKLQEFIKEIQFANRNPKDNSVLELLDDLSTNPEIVFSKGDFLYRSRIVEDKRQLNKEKGFYGYGQKDSFVPPLEHTKDMRANYRYIPYLYCANNRYLSALEVRPRFDAEVSIAKIQALGDLVLLDFTMQETPKKMLAVKQNLFRDLSGLFSKPVAKDDDILDYIPTQYIAEYAKNLNYDGIAFGSSLFRFPHNNFYSYNVVIFQYQKCKPVLSNVYKVTGYEIDFAQMDADTKQQDLSTPLKRTFEI